jgi:hypothetical protein
VDGEGWPHISGGRGFEALPPALEDMRQQIQV